jgi:diketogulonate reductase-like aldo/keto reductase
MADSTLNNLLIVSRIGQGLSLLNENITIGSEEFHERAEIIAYGIANGLTFLDTAQNYANGLSEVLIGKAIEGNRAAVQIATKFSPENSSHSAVIKSLEESLINLKTDYIDLYQIHWPNPRIPLDETLGALKILKDSGKILAIGVCNFSSNQLSEAISIIGENEIVSNQVEYNLYDRYIEDSIIPFSEKNGVKIIAYSPLDKGRTVPDETSRSQLASISRKYGVTDEQVSLAWLLTNLNVIAIPGSKSILHLKQNSESMNIELDDIDIEELNAMRFKIEMVIPSMINVSEAGEENRRVYTSLSEALENSLNLCPSPEDLAQDLLKNPDIKPVRLVPAKKDEGCENFDLIEGRLRYWAWIIAFGFERPIPAYIRSSK